MWDVLWTDPNRELVGEHRAKKEKQREQKQLHKEKDKQREGDEDKENAATKDKGKGRKGSATPSRSSRSSLESPLSFLKARGLKRINTSTSDSRTRPRTISRLTSSSVSSTRSPLSPSFEVGRRESSGLAHAADTSQASDAAETSSPKSPDAYTTAALAEASESKIVEKRPGDEHGDDLSPGVSCTDSVFSKYAESDLTRASIHTSSHGGSFEAPPRSPLRQLRAQAEPSPNRIRTQPSVDASIDAASKIREQLHSPTVPLLSNSGTPKPPKARAWREPEEWDEHLMEQRPVVPGPTTKPRPAASYASSYYELEDIVSWIEDMAKDPLEMILSKLEDCLVTGDALENRRAMLWGLSQFDHPPILEQAFRSSAGADDATTVEPSGNILALYEPSDTASYVAVLHQDMLVHHLAPALAQNDMTTRVLPVTVHSVDPADFPTSTNKFDTVISLRLPSMVSIQDMPNVLQDVHTCLAPRGVFRLTLIDPLPRAGTAGPRLRRWLDRNLTTNLQKASMCTSPRGFFPRWLGDAALRGQGSTWTTTQFFAAPACSSLYQSPARGIHAEVEGDLETSRAGEIDRAKIRSLVGRLLWKEVWGPFIAASEWWWNDADCIQECIEMGTVWEYHVIEAVREG